MARLPRKNIPLDIRCAVAMRQLGFGKGEARAAVEANRRARSLGVLLASLLTQLAGQIGCEVADLRLDHHPALENREQIKDRRGEIVGYIPDELDPDCLIYRDKHSHHIKTNVAGERGQFADNVIAKRRRRREKKATRKEQKTRLRSAPRWGQGPKLRSRNDLRRKR